jgi:hypothetical protein
MGDDRPYTVAVGDRRLTELPVHWSLDDAPHFAATVDPAPLRAAWLAEVELAQRERRHVTFTVHPEIIGRGDRLSVVRAVLETRVPVAPHGAVASARPR